MKSIFIVESNCADPSKEAEFNDWYNNIHIPDVLELDEVKSAVRYENFDNSGNETKYLAIYEIEADDPTTVLDKINEHAKEKAALGRISSLIEVTRTSQFKPTYSVEKE